MIVAKFQFLDVKGEISGRDALEAPEPVLGKGPEAFGRVYEQTLVSVSDVVGRGKIAASDQEGRVLLEAVRVDDLSKACGLQVKVHLEMDDAVTVQFGDEVGEHVRAALHDAEHGHARSASGAHVQVEFAGFREIKPLDGSDDQACIQGVRQYGHAQGGHRLVGGVVCDAELFRHAARGDFQFEELDEAQPLLGAEVAVVYEALAEVVECIGTAGTAPLSSSKCVEFSTAAFGAKSLMVFPAKLQQKFFC